MPNITTNHAITYTKLGSNVEVDSKTIIVTVNYSQNVIQDATEETFTKRSYLSLRLAKRYISQQFKLQSRTKSFLKDYWWERKPVVKHHICHNFQKFHFQQVDTAWWLITVIT